MSDEQIRGSSARPPRSLRLFFAAFAVKALDRKVREGFDEEREENSC